MRGGRGRPPLGSRTGRLAKASNPNVDTRAVRSSGPLERLGRTRGARNRAPAADAPSEGARWGGEGGGRGEGERGEAWRQEGEEGGSGRREEVGRRRASRNLTPRCPKDRAPPREWQRGGGRETLRSSHCPRSPAAPHSMSRARTLGALGLNPTLSVSRGVRLTGQRISVTSPGRQGAGRVFSFRAARTRPRRGSHLPPLHRGSCRGAVASLAFSLAAQS